MPNPELPSSDILTNRFFLTPDEKKKKETGRNILKAFWTSQTSSDSNINSFRGRNIKWIELLLWAKGSQAVQEFLGFMSVSDANKAYTNIDMTQSRVGVKFVGTLVESMAKNRTYDCVTCTDDGSLDEKSERLFEALYRMHDVQTIAQMQQQAGIQLEPTRAFVPDDELAARVYFELNDRLPKEIQFEKYIKNVKDGINFEKVVNPKTIFDLIVLNFAAAKIEKIAPRKYTVRKCVPTNMIYNFFINDNGECEITMIGEFCNIKVKDFRKKFGRTLDNPDGLTEQEIFQLAKLSSTQSLGVFNYTWQTNWAVYPYNYNRPYDDCSIFVLESEINCGEDAYFVSKTDPYGKEDIQAKKNVPYRQQKKDGTFIEQPKPDDVEIIKKKKNSWMRGVYAPYGDKMLFWGQPDIIISKYTDVYNPLSSFTVNIPKNDGEYVPSLFERGMDCLREYQLIKYQRRKLISKVRPAGLRIDVESARNLDLGTGNTVEWEEVVRIYDQTGNELWSSKGVDPLQREAPPLTNTVHDESIEKIIGLSNVLKEIVAELRILWGVPNYRDGADVGDRTSGVLQEQQNSASYNDTDFILRANNQLWEEVSYKLCLLHWNDVVKDEPESKDDMLNTRFDVSVKMKMTDYELQLIEKDIDRFSQMPDANGNPLLTPKDAIMIRNIENFKTACLYLDSVVKENRKKAIEDSQQLQAQNAQVQQQSAQQASEQQMQLQQQQSEAMQKLEQFKSSQAKELAAINGVFSVYTKGLPLPAEWIAFVQSIVPNITLPVIQETKQAAQAIQQGAMMEQQQNNSEQESEQNQEPQMQ